MKTLVKVRNEPGLFKSAEPPGRFCMPTPQIEEEFYYSSHMVKPQRIAFSMLGLGKLGMPETGLSQWFHTS